MGERLITLILLALAVYRVSHLATREDGPWNSAALLRAAARRRFNREVAPGVEAEHWITVGLACPLCLSFWLSLVAWPLGGLLYWLACAGLVLVLHKAVTRDAA